MTTSIVITTFFPEGPIGWDRLRTSVKAVRSWRENLQGDTFHIHIADDGSPTEILTAYVREVKYIWQHEIVTVSCQKRHGVGASLNTGFAFAFKESDVALMAVDDWMLLRPYDLSPWLDLLRQDETVGMVRLGPPHPNLKGQVRMYPSGWGMLLERYGFAYGQRPALYHSRFHYYYGRYAEDCSALECERMYNEHICRSSGPSIVLALPDFWQHLESVSMSGIDPVKSR